MKMYPKHHICSHFFHVHSNMTSFHRCKTYVAAVWHGLEGWFLLECLVKVLGWGAQSSLEPLDLHSQPLWWMVVATLPHNEFTPQTPRRMTTANKSPADNIYGLCIHVWFPAVDSHWIYMNARKGTKSTFSFFLWKWECKALIHQYESDKSRRVLVGVFLQYVACFLPQNCRSPPTWRASPPICHQASGAAAWAHSLQVPELPASLKVVLLLRRVLSSNIQPHFKPEN